MKSANPENEYIPLEIRISVRRDTLRLISEMAQDMGISINEVFSFRDIFFTIFINHAVKCFYLTAFNRIFKRGIVNIAIKVVVKRIFEAVFCFTS